MFLRRAHAAAEEEVLHERIVSLVHKPSEGQAAALSFAAFDFSSPGMVKKEFMGVGSRSRRTDDMAQRREVIRSTDSTVHYGIGLRRVAVYSLYNGHMGSPGQLWVWGQKSSGKGNLCIHSAAMGNRKRYTDAPWETGGKKRNAAWAFPCYELIGPD